MKNQPTSETMYECPSGLVTVVRTNRNLKRCPRHKYKCVLFLLKPQVGTRVCFADDGRVEFMFAWDELRAALGAIDPEIANLLPKEFKNKPIEVKRKYDNWNARRIRRKS